MFLNFSHLILDVEQGGAESGNSHGSQVRRWEIPEEKNGFRFGWEIPGNKKHGFKSTSEILESDFKKWF